MISTSQLLMVRVFLMQELPAPYHDLVSIEDDRIVIHLPDNDASFNDHYDEVVKLVKGSVQRIRNRDYDLSFTIKSSNQLRDFMMTNKQ